MPGRGVALGGKAVLGRHTSRWLFPCVRLFIACTTLILLGLTVSQRDDNDGFQAAHLFFMPRTSWEMDQGTGMLHTDEYYVVMDELVAGGDQDGFMLAFSSQENQRGGSLAVKSEDVAVPAQRAIGASGKPLSGGGLASLRGMEYASNVSDYSIPVAYASTLRATGSLELFAREGLVVQLRGWLGDVPTPPPRYA